MLQVVRLVVVSVHLLRLAVLQALIRGRQLLLIRSLHLLRLLLRRLLAVVPAVLVARVFRGAARLRVQRVLSLLRNQEVSSANCRRLMLQGYQRALRRAVWQLAAYPVEPVRSRPVVSSVSCPGLIRRRCRKV